MNGVDDGVTHLKILQPCFPRRHPAQCRQQQKAKGWLAPKRCPFLLIIIIIIPILILIVILIMLPILPRLLIVLPLQQGTIEILLLLILLLPRLLILPSQGNLP